MPKSMNGDGSAVHSYRRLRPKNKVASRHERTRLKDESFLADKGSRQKWPLDWPADLLKHVLINPPNGDRQPVEI